MSAVPANPEARIVEIVSVLKRRRLAAPNEDALQRAVEEALKTSNIAWMAAAEPQKILSASDRLDLFCAGIAIELKRAGSRREIFRQIERYAALPEVEGLLLVTSTAWPLRQDPVNGKPFIVYPLGLSLSWM